MPHDGQAAPNSPRLADLTALTAAALPEVEALFTDAREVLRARVTVGGKISAAALETEQCAAHTLSWLATYIESLRQLNAWAARLSEQGSFGEMEALLLQIGFGEYLSQLAGGIPMSQNETARLSDLGLHWVPGEAAQRLMASGNNLIKMPINEPAEGKKKSQVQEYLDWHCNTPGVQHLALRTDDELHSIAALRARGVDFLTLPDAYYDQVWGRVNKMLTEHGHSAVKEDHQRVRDLGILVDADDEGYLLQLFTKPLQDRPTLFFEIICRRGSQSFGKGNFKALFEALELEQERRGNL